MTPQQRAYRLLGILQSYADTSEKRQMSANIYNRAVMEEIPYDVIAKQLICVLDDGVNYGNWPWSVHTHGRDDQSVIAAEAATKDSMRRLDEITREARTSRNRPASNR